MGILKDRKTILVCGCLTIFFPGSFVFGFPGVMAAQWQLMFDVDKSQIGQLMFFILAGTGFSMYLSGKFQEKIAPHWIILTGSLFCALSTGLVGLATSITHVYVWSFSQGFCCGFVYIPCLTIYQKLFPENKGLVTGIINLTFGGAAAVMSPLYSFLLVSKGYEATCTITMIVSLCVGTGFALRIKIPESMKKKEHSLVSSLSLRQTIALKPFRYLWCVWALAGAAGVSMIMLSATFGQSLGYDVTQYVLILTCFNILNGAGRIVCGRLADYFPKQKILMTVFILAAGAYFLMPFFKGLYVLSFLACFVGLAFGTMFTVSAPLVTECFGLENFGRVFGLVFTAYGFLAGFLGPWLSGIVLDATNGNFTIVFTGFAFFYLTSAFLILRVKKSSIIFAEQGCSFLRLS
jgi:OFA family oxalate/formate antiporter-like MFS transporter